MTKAQNVSLVVAALAFVVWGVNRFSALAAGVLAVAFGVALVLVALFGDF